MILMTAMTVVLGAIGAVEAEPVNANCPIGKEPIVESAGTVEYKGNTIGLCCPGCGDAFLSWDEQRKDEFVALAVAMEEPEPEPGSKPGSGPEESGASSPSDAEVVEAQLMHYPIDTCIVGGGKLGSMGEPVNYVHAGRLVRFCCAGCVGKFEADPAKYLEALDEKIIAAQLDAYPLDTCPVSGGELGSMGDPVSFVHNNRLVRFCCAPCEAKLVGDPEPYMAKLDAAYADAQRDSYPLDTCVVAGMELGAMGEPAEIVAGTTLVRFCCAGCLPAFQADPAGYLAKLDD